MAKSKKEKVSGRPGGINCQQAQELFYGLAPYGLNAKQTSSLSLHEASCPVCGPEFKEWNRLRGALQDSAMAPVADFKAAVMERIRETQTEPAAKHSAVRNLVRQHGWIRGLAATAAILVMLTGVGKLPPVANLIAQWSKPVTVASNSHPGHPAPTLQQQAPAQPASPANPGNRPSPVTTTGNTATANNGSKSLPAQQQSATPGANSNGTPKFGGTPQTEQYSFDNMPSVITTTTIKINVNNADQAQSAALAIANSVGATLTSEQSAQSSGYRNLLFLHFTVDPGQANTFLDRLGSLGGVASEDRVNKDITSDYASDLEQYQALEAEQSVTPDSDQYNSQLALLESKLQNWHDAAGKQVIMVWLMQ